MRWGTVSLTDDTFIDNQVTEGGDMSTSSISDVAMNFGAQVYTDSFTQMHNGRPYLVRLIQ